MEITLKVDGELVARLREDAERRKTTVEERILQHLHSAYQTSERIEAYVRRTRETAGRSEPGWRFNREECYDRSTEK